MTGDPKEVPLIGQKVIKPPHDPADIPSDDQTEEVQAPDKKTEEMQASDPVQPPILEEPRKNWSLRSYLVAGAVLVVACWAVYESTKRRARKN